MRQWELAHFLFEIKKQGNRNFKILYKEKKYEIFRLLLGSPSVF